LAKSSLGELFETEYFSFKRYLGARFSQINEYDAEDIIQETVFKLLYKGDDILSIKNMTSYMYTALRNGAIDHLKKRKREVLAETQPEGRVQAADEAVIKSEVKRALKEAILSLDERSKFIFIETEIKGRSYKEIAEETGQNIGTLLSRKSRAQKKLKTILKQYFNEEAKQ
jgi:RNA polymerase sigma factor (sigma-70 family)